MTSNKNKDPALILAEALWYNNAEWNESNEDIYNKELDIPNDDDWKKRLEYNQKWLQQHQTIIIELIIWVIIVFIVSLIGRIYDSIWVSHSEREKYYEKAIEMEKKLWEYELKYQLLESSINLEIENIKVISGCNNNIQINETKDIKK